MNKTIASTISRSIDVVPRHCDVRKNETSVVPRNCDVYKNEMNIVPGHCEVRKNEMNHRKSSYANRVRGMK